MTISEDEIQKLLAAAEQKTRSFPSLDDGVSIDYDLPCGDYWLIYRLMVALTDARAVIDLMVEDHGWKRAEFGRRRNESE